VWVFFVIFFYIHLDCFLFFNFCVNLATYFLVVIDVAIFSCYRYSCN
jgi:hypothetical protein